MPKLSDYAKPAKAAFTLEERLAAACVLAETLRESHGNGATRAIDRLKLAYAQEATEERLQWGLTPEETLLLYTLLHA